MQFYPVHGFLCPLTVKRGDGLSLQGSRVLHDPTQTTTSLFHFCSFVSSRCCADQILQRVTFSDWLPLRRTFSRPHARFWAHSHCSFVSAVWRDHCSHTDGGLGCFQGWASKALCLCVGIRVNLIFHLSGITSTVQFLGGVVRTWLAL